MALAANLKWMEVLPSCCRVVVLKAIVKTAGRLHTTRRRPARQTQGGRFQPRRTMSGWQHSFLRALMAGRVASAWSRSSLRPASAAAAQHTQPHSSTHQRVVGVWARGWLREA